MPEFFDAGLLFFWISIFFESLWVGADALDPASGSALEPPERVSGVVPFCWANAPPVAITTTAVASKRVFMRLYV